MAKFGHVVGTKRERKPAKPWWAQHEEETIRKIEQEWQLKQCAARVEDPAAF